MNARKRLSLALFVVCLFTAAPPASALIWYQYLFDEAVDETAINTVRNHYLDEIQKSAELSAMLEILIGRFLNRRKNDSMDANKIVALIRGNKTFCSEYGCTLVILKKTSRGWFEAVRTWSNGYLVQTDIIRSAGDFTGPVLVNETNKGCSNLTLNRDGEYEFVLQPNKPCDNQRLNKYYELIDDVKEGVSKATNGQCLVIPRDQSESAKLICKTAALLGNARKAALSSLPAGWVTLNGSSLEFEKSMLDRVPKYFQFEEFRKKSRQHSSKEVERLSK